MLAVNYVEFEGLSLDDEPIDFQSVFSNGLRRLLASDVQQHSCREVSALFPQIICELVDTSILRLALITFFCTSVVPGYCIAFWKITRLPA